MEFLKYGSISRIGNQDTDGILFGGVWVSPKLDGTNSSVWKEDGVVRCGSRKREISIEDDNAGFCKFISGYEAIKNLLDEKSNWRLYGEWLVPHTVRDYEDWAWKQFYVYDVMCDDKYLTPDEWEKAIDGYGIGKVPYVYVEHPTPESITEIGIELSRFLIKDRNIGEGFTIKNYDFINKFGECKFAKIINKRFTEAMGVRPQKEFISNPIESELAELCVTPDLVAKTKAKIVNEAGSWNNKLIARVLETVWHDAFHEEFYDAAKKMKNPSVDLKVFKNKCFQKAREILL